MNKEELMMNMDRCINGIAQVDCEDCPYNKENFCRLFLMRDALNYIKGEAEVEVAKKIFADLFGKVGFDGHNVAISKNELVEVAKKYGVEV